MQLCQNLRHFQTGPETAGTGRPQAVFPERLNGDLGGFLTSPPKLTRILEMSLFSDVLHATV